MTSHLPKTFVTVSVHVTALPFVEASFNLVQVVEDPDSRQTTSERLSVRTFILVT